MPELSRVKRKIDYSSAFITRKRRVKSVQTYAEGKSVEIIQREKDVCKRFGITHDQWNEFIDIIHQKFHYDKSFHNIFHAELEDAVEDMKLNLTTNSGGNGCIRHSTKATKDNMEFFVDLYCFDRPNNSYTIYRILKVEFRELMCRLFMDRCEWMDSDCALSTVPTPIMRGAVIALGPICDKIIRGMPNDLIKLDRSFHVLMDLFYTKIIYHSDVKLSGKTLAASRHKKIRKPKRNQKVQREDVLVHTDINFIDDDEKIVYAPEEGADLFVEGDAASIFGVGPEFDYTMMVEEGGGEEEGEEEEIVESDNSIQEFSEEEREHDYGYDGTQNETLETVELELPKKITTSNTTRRRRIIDSDEEEESEVNLPTPEPKLDIDSIENTADKTLYEQTMPPGLFIDNAGNILLSEGRSKKHIEFRRPKVNTKFVPLRDRKTSEIDGGISKYDIGFYIFTRAKELANSTNTFIGNCYKICAQNFIALDKDLQNDIVKKATMMKEAVFGSASRGLAHVLSRENLVLHSKVERENIHRICIGDSGDDTVIISFDRNDVAILDVYFTLAYYRQKYLGIFTPDLANIMSWNERGIHVELTRDDFKNLTGAINVFELSRCRAQDVKILYPLIADIFYDKSVDLRVEGAKCILHLIRSPGDMKRNQDKWISRGIAGIATYLDLLPAIISLYRSVDSIWDALTTCYNNIDELNVGGRKSARDFRESPLKRKSLLKSATSFIGHARNIYVGLESYFSVRAYHAIKKNVAHDLVEYIGLHQWAKVKYLNLYDTFLGVCNGTFQAQGNKHGDPFESYYDMPYDINGNYKPDFDDLEYSLNMRDTIMYHVYCLITDHRMDRKLAVCVFESIILRSVTPTSNTTHSLPIRTAPSNLHQVDSMRYEMHKTIETMGLRGARDDKESCASENELFVFFIEALERLFYYNTNIGKGVDTRTNPEYRGIQRLPTYDQRWLAFDNTVIGVKSFARNEFPLYANATVAPIGTFLKIAKRLNRKFAGRKEDFNVSLKNSPNWSTVTSLNAEFMNTVICFGDAVCNI